MIKYPVKVELHGEEYGYSPLILDADDKPVIQLEAVDLNEHHEPKLVNGRRSDWVMADTIVNALNAMNEVPYPSLHTFWTTVNWFYKWVSKETIKDAHAEDIELLRKLEDLRVKTEVIELLVTKLSAYNLIPKE